MTLTNAEVRVNNLRDNKTAAKIIGSILEDCYNLYKILWSERKVFLCKPAVSFNAALKNDIIFAYSRTHKVKSFQIRLLLTSKSLVAGNINNHRRYKIQNIMFNEWWLMELRS